MVTQNIYIILLYFFAHTTIKEQRCRIKNKNRKTRVMNKLQLDQILPQDGQKLRRWTFDVLGEKHVFRIIKAIPESLRRVMNNVYNNFRIKFNLYKIPLIIPQTWLSLSQNRRIECLIWNAFA